MWFTYHTSGSRDGVEPTGSRMAKLPTMELQLTSGCSEQRFVPKYIKGRKDGDQKKNINQLQSSPRNK